ncbi:MAG TPA: RsmE family RNA methyltransferase [Candidatus Eisenbacteria bacterium]|nr:RsmE family RNA methyltransferase [Candidatus Eisenbacteria bacterium]
MTRRRWIADEFANDRAALRGAHAAHLSRALRARVGQEFEVACGEVVRRATVTRISEERVEFALGEEVAAKVVAPVTLVLAVFKFDRMEWALEKCTELNVTSIVPVIARRTEKHLALAAEKRVERWRRIGREAAEQARRVSPPEIGNPVKVAEALNSRAALRVVLAETEREAQLSDVLRERPALASLALAVGPEGGWAPDELQQFEKAGWVSASLGATILRAETAAIAAVAIARAEME